MSSIFPTTALLTYMLSFFYKTKKEKKINGCRTKTVKNIFIHFREYAFGWGYFEEAQIHYFSIQLFF